MKGIVSVVCLVVCLMSEAMSDSVYSSQNNTIVVSLNPGQSLKGFYRALATGTVIYKFWGIRYGQAPVGNKRFAAPEPEPNWKGEKDADDFGKKCIQTPGGSDAESEDCLFLNVYSPNVTGSAPVMVWIHGGGYVTGSGSEFMYDGSTLACHGVVVVTINYRLGAYGFLSTGDDVMPGNYGMLDQVLALKWVQKNIHAFGGDPKTVTIFGESAGSSSVSLHIVSPLSKGLFHRAIMESGSSLGFWAVERPATEIGTIEYTRLVGEKVGCVDKDSTKFLACLRQVDVLKLYNASITVKTDLHIDIIATPRVETAFGFLPNYPQYLLDNGLFNKVDTIRGFNSGEWSVFITDADNDGLTRDEFTENFKKIFTTYSLNNSSREYVVNLVEKIYLNNQTDFLTIRTSLIAALRDILFATSELSELEKYLAHGAAANRHYVYELDYRIKSKLNLHYFGPVWWGTIHSEDLPFVFQDDQVGIIAYLTPPDDLNVGNKIQTWWTNFAKFGNPSQTKVLEDGTEVQWGQYSATTPNLLKISLKSNLITNAKNDLLPTYDNILNFLINDNVTAIN